jgi:hypothetical protein
MSLSDFACKNAKPKDKPYRLADGDGLYLLVRNNGSKLWQLRYRYLEKEISSPLENTRWCRFLTREGNVTTPKDF